jgi:predicted RNase H-like nuclease
MVWLCGVDGFKSQWCAVLRNLDTNEFRVRVVPFRDLLSLPENPAIVALDLPIGLPDVTLPGGRTCERLARKIVGGHRARSVFSAVGRVALAAASISKLKRLMPVTLPFGRLRLVTTPLRTGSSTAVNTMGIVELAALAANAEGAPPAAAMTATLSATSSSASIGS